MSQKLGIFGGTFDPPHIGHLVLAQQAAQSFALDKVVFMPTGKPARKLATTIASPRQRLEMLQLALANNSLFEVSALEVEREGITYTADTVVQLRAQYSRSAKLYFIVGADSICDLPTWRCADILSRELVFLGAKRSGYDTQVCTDSASQHGFDVRLFSMPTIDVSSNFIRKELALGHSVRYLVSSAVIDYIGEHGLYAGL